MGNWCSVIFRRGGVGVALDECTFRLPVHERGVRPERVEIRQGGLRYASFDALARAEGTLEIEVVTIGRNGQPELSIIQNWDIDKVVDGPGNTCTIHLQEARRELAWYTCTQDINLKRWTGYVPGTAGYEPGAKPGGNTKIIDTPLNMKEALQAFSLLPPLRDRMHPEAFDSAPETPIRDQIFISGLQMDQAAEVLEEVTGLDLVLDPATRLYCWRPRQDTSGALSPDWQDHAWLHRPGWTRRSTLRTAYPERIVGQYRKRRTLHVVNKNYYDRLTGDFAIDQVGLPGIPKVIFENVYDFAGRWMTLGDMLEVAGYPRDALGDPDGPTGRGNKTAELTIASNIMEDNWGGTALFYAARPSTVDKGIDALVRKAIRDGWRKYYAIRFLNDQGVNLWGGYSDLHLGEENFGGGFRAGQVFTGWTEIYAKPQVDKIEGTGREAYRMVEDHEAGLGYPGDVLERLEFPWTGFDGARYSQLSVSPFKLEWKDRDNGIVWVKANSSRLRGSTAFVGRPTKKSLAALSSGAKNSNDQNEKDIAKVADARIDALPTEAKRALQFRETYDLHAYISAIVEAPQGYDGIDDRFYRIERTYDGQNPVIKMPVPESPEALYGATESETPVNLQETHDDFIRRATDLLGELGARAQGEGETMDVADVIVRVMDQEMVRSALIVNENVITATVEMGNEGNPSARKRNAMKREAGRKFKLAGKETG